MRNCRTFEKLQRELYTPVSTKNSLVVLDVAKPKVLRHLSFMQFDFALKRLSLGHVSAN